MQDLRSEPPVCDRSIVIGSTLGIRPIVCAAFEISQLRALVDGYRVYVVEARFGRTEQENFCGQSVGAAIDGSPEHGTAFAVRYLYLFNGVLDARLKQIQERAVQVGMDGAVGVGIVIQAMPLAIFVDVLHQNPCAVAACIVDARIRDTLMHHNEISDGTTHRDFDRAAHGQSAQRCTALILHPCGSINSDICFLNLISLVVYSDIYIRDFFTNVSNSNITTHCTPHPLLIYTLMLLPPA